MYPTTYPKSSFSVGILFCSHHRPTQPILPVYSFMFLPISTIAHRLPTFVTAAKTAFQARRFAFFPLIFYEAKSNRKSLCSNGTLKVDAEEICDGMLVACTMRSFSFHFFVCHFSICLLQFSTQMNKKLHNKDRVRLLFTFIWMLVKK